jgi:pyridoxine 4-dehydrogenase
VLEHCEREGLGFIPWAPIAAGELANPGGPVDAIVKETGALTSQVALAWLLARSPVMLPIPGTSSVGHLEDNCGAASLQLTEAQVRSLTDAR